MIRPLRSRHRAMILAVALLVGLLAIFGLRFRRAVPTVDRLPQDASTASAPAETNR